MPGRAAEIDALLAACSRIWPGLRRLFLSDDLLATRMGASRSSIQKRRFLSAKRS